MIEIRGTTTLVGLLGWPTSHSLSPPMQNAGFAALGLDWAYVPLPTPPELLADAVRGLQALGFAGANVTIPHKQAVIPLCDELDEIARAAGSVNTLVFDDGRVLGSSTDGDAVTAQIDADGRRALVLGAGGRRSGGRRGARARRSGGDDGEPSRARLAALGRRVRHPRQRDPGEGGADRRAAPGDGGRRSRVPARRPRHGSLAAARAAGCDVVVDGLDVLLFQGAASFERWTGLPAPLVAMREALRGA